MILNYQFTPEFNQIKKIARQNGIPLFGGFELTSRCNFNCKMCYVHDNTNLLRELSTDQWKHIFDDAINAGMMFALLTGGECLLREDFEELYLYLYRKGVLVSVNTNASLIDESIADFFAAHIPERIQISVYGSNEDAYCNVTERKFFNKVMRGITLLKDRNLVPDIAITPSSYMKDDFENILRLVQQLDCPYTITYNLFPPRNGESILDCCLSIDEKIMLKRISRDVRHQTLFTPSDAAPEPGKDGDHCETGMPCNAGTVRFVITSSGLMIPCMSIPEISIDALSNPFDVCWTFISSTMKKTLQPEACSNCAYKKKCFRCPVTRCDGLFSGKRNKDICKFMVRQYEEGLINFIEQ